jgi:hypothetical protein
MPESVFERYVCNFSIAASFALVVILTADYFAYDLIDLPKPQQ